MDYKRKIKKRLYCGSAMIIFSIIIIAMTFVFEIKDGLLYSLGLAFPLTLLGIILIVQNALMLKNKDMMKKQQILETDEREVMLTDKSGRLTYSISVIGCASLSIILTIADLYSYGRVLLWIAIAQLWVYNFCRWFLSKKF